MLKWQVRGEKKRKQMKGLIIGKTCTQLEFLRSPCKPLEALKPEQQFIRGMKGVEKGDKHVIPTVLPTMPEGNLLVMGNSCFSKGVAEIACKQRPYKTARGHISAYNMALVGIEAECSFIHVS